MEKEKPMKSQNMNSHAGNARNRLSLIGFACAFALVFASPAFPQSKTAAATAPAQKTFATAEGAAAAFIEATKTFDVPALNEILGPEGEDLVSSGDPVMDKNIAASFHAKAQQKHSVAIDPKNPNRATLIVGEDDFPLAIPIVKRSNGGWLFDTKAGRQEVLYRRIGSNELDAIEICRGYVDAQKEYALEKHDDAKVNQYAQRVISTSGKHDGLVWRNEDGSLGGPMSEGIANALQEGYTDKAKPYHGYFFKILKGQGPSAPLGSQNFVVEGAMIGGFALAAAPAHYRVTGVKTFIVSYRGIVYEKDLGPDTLNKFKEMELYDPDKSWKPTNDDWPADVSDAAAPVTKE